MKVVIAGGHGQIARRLGRLLAAHGDRGIGIIRNPAHRDDLRTDRIEPAVCDLETASCDDVAAVLSGADAVVFAAGAGPGSGAARKRRVDHDAAALTADAAVRAGVRRYVMVSTMGAGRPAPAHADEVWTAYVHAKTAADEYLAAQDLDWTILRPAALTNAPGAGTVRLTAEPSTGEISRDDVADVLVCLLDTPDTAGLVLELAEGSEVIPAAVSHAVKRSVGRPGQPGRGAT